MSDIEEMLVAVLREQGAYAIGGPAQDALLAAFRELDDARFGWEEEARRYSANADYWHSKYIKADARIEELEKSLYDAQYAIRQLEVARDE